MKTLSILFATLALGGLQASQAADENDFVSVLNTSNAVRIAYTEQLQSNGVLPSSLADLGFDESYFQTELIEHIDIDPVSGAIMVGLVPDFGQNEWLALIPTIANSNILSWACQTTAAEEFTTTSDCTANVAYEDLTHVLDANIFENTFLQINTIKANAAESLANSGRFPRSMNELGVSEDWLGGANVSGVVVMPYFNTIFFALESVYGSNQWISVRPRISQGNITSWSCKTTLPNTVVNIPGCITSVASENLFW